MPQRTFTMVTEKPSHWPNAKKNFALERRSSKQLQERAP